MKRRKYLPGTGWLVALGLSAILLIGAAGTLGKFTAAILSPSDLDVTMFPGSDICTQIVNAMTVAPTGAHLRVPAGNFTCTAENIVVPNDGAIPPNQKSFRLYGAGADPGTANFTSIGRGPLNGTIINIANTGPAIDTRGQGRLEVTGISFAAPSGNCQPFIYNSNTNADYHDNYFYGSLQAYITTAATRVQSSGGSGTLKYFVDTGLSTNGQAYSLGVYVKNQGAGNVIVSSNTSAAGAFSQTVTPGSIVLVRGGFTGDGTNDLQIRLSTQNIGDAMDIVAFLPSINPNTSGQSNQLSGGQLNFSTWTANGGASMTITQSQSVQQEPCNDVLITGGSANNVDATSNGAFQGYGLNFHDNHANRVRAMVWARTYSNAMNVQNNTVWLASGALTKGAFEIDTGVQGNVIHGNLVEAFFYPYVVHMLNNSQQNIASGNQAWDVSGSTQFQNNFKAESGSCDNVVISQGITGWPTFGEYGDANSPACNILISPHGMILGGEVTTKGGTQPGAVPIAFNRTRYSLGSTVVCGDFALSGWGSTASCAAAQGTDALGLFQVTSSGTGQTANPTITFTLHDGTFNTPAVIPMVSRCDTNSPSAPFVFTSGNSVNPQFAFLGTPVAGNTYCVGWNIQGRK